MPLSLCGAGAGTQRSVITISTIQVQTWLCDTQHMCYTSSGMHCQLHHMLLIAVMRFVACCCLLSRALLCAAACCDIHTQLIKELRGVHVAAASRCHTQGLEPTVATSRK
jgi:hypothetical protein